MKPGRKRSRAISLFLFIRRFSVQHSVLAGLLAVVLPVILRLSLLPYFPIPHPYVHDEFSYLLGADTFASGRLTNPPHPLWIHFETFHVNQQPTYATKYPPGQSLFLATGQKLFGDAWYGVLLSVGVMSLCIYWMLRGWLPPPYPLLGSLFGSVQFCVATYWGNSYWGGAVAAAGGALVAGAIPRLAAGPNGTAAFLAAVGAITLANTRPYEGFIFAATSALMLAYWRRSRRVDLRSLLSPRIVFPVAIVLCGGFLWMAYYNHRVTGHYWLMPYLVNDRAYAQNPVLWVLPAGPIPEYRHQVIRTFWSLWRTQYEAVRNHPLEILKQFQQMLGFFLPVPLLILAVISIVIYPSRKGRIALGILGVLSLGVLLEPTVFAHYYAPATALLLFLVLGVVRLIIRVLIRYGSALDFAVAAGVIVLLIAIGAKTVKRVSQPRGPFPADRYQILDMLQKTRMRHLVIVRYSAEHNVNEEWVYNQANIDQSAVVWARDMGEASNRELLDYYRDRQIWLFEPDAHPRQLKKYNSPWQ
jgi:hypothetical protein